MPASTMFVPANYFKTLGVALARGAGFDASADEPLRAEPVVILSYAFWQNRLSADPDIVGKTLTMDGTPHVVVGVAPDQFGGHIGIAPLGPLCSARTASAPLARTGAVADRELSRRSLEGVAEHSRPAVAWRQRSAGERGGGRCHGAAGESVSGDQRVQGRDRRGVRPARHSLPFATQASFRRSALTLTGMVLLVVSLNISGMMQVRGAMRERELSIRQATRRQPGTAGSVPPVRSDCAGVCGRRARLAGALQPPSLVSWLTGDIDPATGCRRHCGSISPWSRSCSGSVFSRAWCSDGCRPCASAVP